MTAREQTPSTPSPAGRRNQRRFRRQSAKGSTKATAYRNSLGLGPNIASSVLDVSEWGARLLMKEDLAANTEFEVNFESHALSKPVRMIATVVWSVPAADGRFVVGARFQKPFDYAALQSLTKS